MIFTNFVAFVKKFADPEKQHQQVQQIQKWKSATKSSGKKKQSSIKKQFVEATYDVSSFNLLAERDMSQSNPNVFEESSYLSSNAGDRSVSTALN